MHLFQILIIPQSTLNKGTSCLGKVSYIINVYRTLLTKFRILFKAWDLLRIDVYGFKSLCEWFKSMYPNHFVSPLRISGSAVETLFSQFKHNAGGKLDAVNYSTSRAAYLVKQGVSKHHSGKGYRDTPLSTSTVPLKKKKYNKKRCHTNQ